MPTTLAVLGAICHPMWALIFAMSVWHCVVFDGARSIAGQICSGWMDNSGSFAWGPVLCRQIPAAIAHGCTDMVELRPVR